jgi:hypothetical protein
VVANAGLSALEGMTDNATALPRQAMRTRLGAWRQWPRDTRDTLDCP